MTSVTCSNVITEGEETPNVTDPKPKPGQTVLRLGSLT